MKRSQRLCFAFLALGPAALLTAVERLPIEDFARDPETAEVRLSPDGQSVALLRPYLGRPALFVSEIGKKGWRLDLGEAKYFHNETKGVVSYEWVSDRRLLVTTGVSGGLLYGVLALDRDGKNAVPISGYEDEQPQKNDSRFFGRKVIHRFFDQEESVLMLDDHERSAGNPAWPDVVTVHTRDGRMGERLKNPDEVTAWAADSNGIVRFGVLVRGELSGGIYRESAAAPWRPVLPLEDRKGGLFPVGFDSAHEKILVGALTKEQRWTVFPLDPATGRLGEAVVTDPEYDILPRHFMPVIDSFPLSAPIFSPKGDALLGVRYVTDAPRVQWFDREYAVRQRTVDRALPDTVNILVDTSLDGKRLLWLAFSDQDPGTYYLADETKRTFSPVVARMSWIKPGKMWPTRTVHYQARDGLKVHGFLTVPVGHEPKNLPIVVMPHDGPWVRDVWGYDPLVQLLANRGYAVLQMNYRGSPGYGEELYQNARRQIGGKIQDDIEDATRWSIAAGIADPKRIAIFGESYGGYSALFGLGHSPDLYCCGISYAGVTDWSAFLQESDVVEYKEASQYWREQLGDPEKDKELLRLASPVNFADKITAPVLIVQGKEDRRVPPDQAKRMITALEKAGHKPESSFISGLAHSLSQEKDRLTVYKTIVTFLEKNLGPGVN